MVSTLGRHLTKVHVPWVGKRFDRSVQRGTNSLTGVARLAKLIAPTYRFTRGDVHLEGFEMTNWVEPGKLDPNTDVYVIDYESAGNPWPFKHVRDEVVEIVAAAVSDHGTARYRPGLSQGKHLRLCIMS
jgi:hypothetical protein